MSELDDFEVRIIANVDEFGCQVNHIFDPEQKNPDWSYSIGFPKTIGQPEVIIFGLRNDLMNSMINETLRQCKDGLILKDGEVISGLLEGFDCVARLVPASNITTEHFNSAMWFDRYWGGEGIQSAFQFVWPGAIDGLYPWDEGASQDVIDAQPALYEVAA